MPRYRYIGADPRVLHGLSHGVNATLTRRGGHDQPDGSTVSVVFGDVVETDEPYVHALLEELAAAKPARKATTRKPAGAAPVATPDSTPTGADSTEGKE